MDVKQQRVHFPGDESFTFAPLINGCWQLAGGHGRGVFDDIQEKLSAHARAGLTTFDTADIYRQSEAILGDFQEACTAAGNPPAQIFTKYVPNIFQQRPTAAAAEAAVQRACANLKVDCLDLVQLHWWDYSVPGMVETAQHLADLKDRGLIKHVGVTNMDVQALQQIVDAGVPVVSNQVQFSLLDRRPLNGMLQYCQQRGIKLLTYGSLAGGLLSDTYVEQPRRDLLGRVKYGTVDLNTSSLKMYYNNVRLGGQEGWRSLLLVLREIADKHNVSVANVALRWVMQQGDGNTVVPIVGLRGVAHIEDNLKALHLELTQEDMAAIETSLQSVQSPDGDIYSQERA